MINIPAEKQKNLDQHYLRLGNNHETGAPDPLSLANGYTLKSNQKRTPRAHRTFRFSWGLLTILLLLLL